MQYLLPAITSTLHVILHKHSLHEPTPNNNSPNLRKAHVKQYNAITVTNHKNTKQTCRIKLKRA